MSFDPSLSDGIALSVARTGGTRQEIGLAVNGAAQLPGAGVFSMLSSSPSGVVLEALKPAPRPRTRSPWDKVESRVAQVWQGSHSPSQSPSALADEGLDARHDPFDHHPRRSRSNTPRRSQHGGAEASLPQHTPSNTHASSATRRHGTESLEAVPRSLQYDNRSRSVPRNRRRTERLASTPHSSAQAGTSAVSARRPAEMANAAQAGIAGASESARLAHSSAAALALPSSQAAVVRPASRSSQRITMDQFPLPPSIDSIGLSRRAASVGRAGSAARRKVRIEPIAQVRKALSWLEAPSPEGIGYESHAAQRHQYEAQRRKREGSPHGDRGAASSPSSPPRRSVSAGAPLRRGRRRPPTVEHAKSTTRQGSRRSSKSHQRIEQSRDVGQAYRADDRALIPATVKSVHEGPNMPDDAVWMGRMRADQWLVQLESELREVEEAARTLNNQTAVSSKRVYGAVGELQSSSNALEAELRLGSSLAGQARQLVAELVSAANTPGTGLHEDAVTMASRISQAAAVAAGFAAATVEAGGQGAGTLGVADLSARQSLQRAQEAAQVASLTDITPYLGLLHASSQVQGANLGARLLHVVSGSSAAVAAVVSRAAGLAFGPLTADTDTASAQGLPAQKGTPAPFFTAHDAAPTVNKPRSLHDKSPENVSSTSLPAPADAVSTVNKPRSLHDNPDIARDAAPPPPPPPPPSQSTAPSRPGDSPSTSVGLNPSQTVEHDTSQSSWRLVDDTQEHHFQPSVAELVEAAVSKPPPPPSGPPPPAALHAAKRRRGRRPRQALESSAPRGSSTGRVLQPRTPSPEPHHRSHSTPASAGYITRPLQPQTAEERQHQLQLSSPPAARLGRPAQHNMVGRSDRASDAQEEEQDDNEQDDEEGVGAVSEFALRFTQRAAQQQRQKHQQQRYERQIASGRSPPSSESVTFRARRRERGQTARGKRAVSSGRTRRAQSDGRRGRARPEVARPQQPRSPPQQAHSQPPPPPPPPPPPYQPHASPSHDVPSKTSPSSSQTSPSRPTGVLRPRVRSLRPGRAKSVPPASSSRSPDGPPGIMTGGERVRGRAANALTGPARTVADVSAQHQHRGSRRTLSASRADNESEAGARSGSAGAWQRDRSADAHLALLTSSQIAQSLQGSLHRAVDDSPLPDPTQPLLGNGYTPPHADVDTHKPGDAATMLGLSGAHGQLGSPGEAGDAGGSSRGGRRYVHNRTQGNAHHQSHNDRYKHRVRDQDDEADMDDDAFGKSGHQHLQLMDGPTPEAPGVLAPQSDVITALPRGTRSGSRGGRAEDSLAPPAEGSFSFPEREVEAAASSQRDAILAAPPPPPSAISGPPALLPLSAPAYAPLASPTASIDGSPTLTDETTQPTRRAITASSSEVLQAAAAAAGLASMNTARSVFVGSSKSSQSMPKSERRYADRVTFRPASPDPPSPPPSHPSAVFAGPPLTGNGVYSARSAAATAVDLTSPPPPPPPAGAIAAFAADAAAADTDSDSVRRQSGAESELAAQRRRLRPAPRINKHQRLQQQQQRKADGSTQSIRMKYSLSRAQGRGGSSSLARDLLGTS